MKPSEGCRREKLNATQCKLNVLEFASTKGKSAGLDGTDPTKLRDKRKQNRNSRDSTKGQAPLMLENTLRHR